MYPRAFEYFCPETLEKAIELLSKYGEEAKVLAARAEPHSVDETEAGESAIPD